MLKKILLVVFIVLPLSHLFGMVGEITPADVQSESHQEQPNQADALKGQLRTLLEEKNYAYFHARGCCIGKAPELQNMTVDDVQDGDTDAHARAEVVDPGCCYDQKMDLLLTVPLDEVSYKQATLFVNKTGIECGFCPKLTLTSGLGFIWSACMVKACMAIPYTYNS